MHAQKVIHRDLKSANVFLRDEGGAFPALKLGDFGISRLMSSHTALAQTAVGTPYYLSPELIEGKGYDARADVWSLGCICYELLALRRPWSGDNIALLAMNIIRQP